MKDKLTMLHLDRRRPLMAWSLLSDPAGVRCIREIWAGGWGCDRYYGHGSLLLLAWPLRVGLVISRTRVVYWNSGSGTGRLVG